MNSLCRRVCAGGAKPSWPLGCLGVCPGRQLVFGFRVPEVFAFDPVEIFRAVDNVYRLGAHGEDVCGAEEPFDQQGVVDQFSIDHGLDVVAVAVAETLQFADPTLDGASPFLQVGDSRCPLRNGQNESNPCADNESVGI